MFRPLVVLLLALLSLTSLTACGDGSDTATTDLPTKKIAITFSGDTVTPNGDRVDVKIGQTVQLVVTADAAGEIHVHSDPEKELEYGKGTTVLELSFDHAGIIEVESHALEKTIVQLQVE
ncbi:MAG: hypothetical protein QM572_01510 [Nocardioides sp.]|uniref:hypothetical protein n=1 Tax=Nocardioides sp. TaxID=35761 RepID=UPI0039E630D4